MDLTPEEWLNDMIREMEKRIAEGGMWKVHLFYALNHVKWALRDVRQGGPLAKHWSIYLADALDQVKHARRAFCKAYSVGR